jgi:hypothetical protein
MKNGPPHSHQNKYSLAIYCLTTFVFLTPDGTGMGAGKVDKVVG